MGDWKTFADTIKELLKSKNLTAAKEELTIGLEKFPNQVNLLTIATDVYRASGDREKSLEYSELLITHHPDNWNGYGRAAKDLVALKRFEEAQEKVQAGLEKFPNQVNLLTIATDAYNSSDYPEKSLEYAELLITHHPDKEAGYAKKIRTLIHSDQFEKAEKEADIFLERFPTSIAPRSLACTIYAREGQKEKHVKAAESMIEKFPEQINGYRQKINALSNTNRESELIEELNKASRRLKNEFDLQSLWRSYFRAKGKREESLKMSAEILTCSNKQNRNNWIEYSKDLLLLRQIDSYISTIKRHKLAGDRELESLKGILEPYAPRKLSVSEKNLINDLKIFPHYSDSRFNPSPEKIIQNSRVIPCIVLIHVGKCGGESLKHTLRRDFGFKAKVFEYHIFDSNLLIADLFSKLSDADNIHFVICTRDPASRWVSAYNYEAHLYQIKRLFYSPRFVHDFYAKYDRVDNLIDGLAISDPEALRFAKFHHLGFGHMAMGFSWYLPKELAVKLPPDKSHHIRLEHINEDYTNLLTRLCTLFGTKEQTKSSSNVKVLELNSAWMESYGKDQFVQYSELSVERKQFLAKFLDHEYKTIDLISKTACSRQN